MPSAEQHLLRSLEIRVHGVASVRPSAEYYIKEGRVGLARAVEQQSVFRRNGALRLGILRPEHDPLYRGFSDPDQALDKLTALTSAPSGLV